MNNVTCIKCRLPVSNTFVNLTLHKVCNRSAIAKLEKTDD